MKTKFCTLITIAWLLFAFSSCVEKDELKDSSITLGAQANTTVDGFYAVGENKTYTMAEASADQANVDIFCFYELTDAIFNYTCLASPGSSITGIFAGEDAPEAWTTKNVTMFYQTTLTAVQFDAVQDDDALLYSSFVAADARKKAKDVKVDQVWAFKTTDNIYGLIKIKEVTHGNDGSVSFEMKSMFYEESVK